MSHGKGPLYFLVHLVKKGQDVYSVQFVVSTLYIQHYNDRRSLKILTFRSEKNMQVLVKVLKYIRLNIFLFTMLFLILYRRQVVEGVTECTLD